MLKVNIAWKTTTLSRKELNDYLAKFPQYLDNFYIISDDEDKEDFMQYKNYSHRTDSVSSESRGNVLWILFIGSLSSLDDLIIIKYVGKHVGQACLDVQ
jgi:hypothetical protein